MAPAPVGAAATTGVATVLDTGDMQGLVGRAYGNLPFARYLLLGIGNPKAARAWLRAIIDELTTAADHGEALKGPCLNVAFTGPGLARLGLAPDDIASLPRPVQEGMVTEHRSRFLGDYGVNAPTTWRWGGPTNQEIHLVVMVFAGSEDELESACASRRAVFESGGALVEAAAPIEGRLTDVRGREHFGFADGLSQPVLKGWPHGTSSRNPPAMPQPPKWSEVNPGEIVLGYDDNYNKLSQGPTVAPASDPGGLLPPAAWDASGRHHLGHNGTFLVLRQLAQDVAGFRRFAQSDGTANPTGDPLAIPGQLGAKLVGRWPNGAPVVLAPERDDQAAPGANDFGYHDLDLDGLRCPLGAHVRRSNPRDTTANSPTTALSSTKNHRILRRGRPYGLPIVVPPTRPGEDVADERGLIFLCLNADIERQFEFVQHTWLDNPCFAGLYGEVDPVTGNQPPLGGTFTLQADPIRQKLTGLPTFVTVKGGAYFFLPGIRALRYLAGMNP